MTDQKIANGFMIFFGMAVALLLGLVFGFSVSEQRMPELSAESVEEVPPAESSVQSASEEVLLPWTKERQITLLTVDGARFIIVYTVHGAVITPYKPVSRF